MTRIKKQPIHNQTRKKENHFFEVSTKHLSGARLQSAYSKALAEIFSIRLGQLREKQESLSLMKKKNMKKELKQSNWQRVGDKFKGAKIAKTFRIDADIFLWLRQEAERTGIPCQTLLNDKLREAMNYMQKVKRSIFTELVDGIKAMRKHREEKLTLKTLKVKSFPKKHSTRRSQVP